MNPPQDRLQDFLQAARALAGDAAVLVDPSRTAPYSTDWRGRYSGRPLAVLLPASAQQLAGLVRLALAHRVSLVPQGGNTGLSGGATPDDSGTQVVVLTARMAAIRARDADNKTLTVEAGLTLSQAQQAASDMGLLFPLSLGAQDSATVGGVLSTNAGGTAVLRYGNARELCLGLEVVTPSGEIWDGLRGLRKDNTGYDLRDLFIGAEGTLGFITAAVLKLHPRPAGITTALVRVAGPDQALALLRLAQSRCDAALTGFEFMTAVSTQLVVQRLPQVAQPALPMIGGDAHRAPAATVLIEISHPESESAATAMLESLMTRALDDGLIEDAMVAQSLAQAGAMWQLRESITLAAADDGPHIKHDIALPVSALSRFIADMDAELLQAYCGVQLVNFGHFGDGNLHYNIGPPISCGDGRDRAARHAAYRVFLQQHEDDIRRRVHDRVMAMGGSISAEHGLGQLRRLEARHYKSTVEINLMQAIKQALDPQGIMNPGKVL